MQTKRTQRIPGPDDPIVIQPAQERVIVRLGGRVVADTQNALVLRESDYDAVHYIPIGDVNMSLLEPTAHSTYCPYKGDASYYSIPIGGGRSENAVWTYETPYEAVAEIKDHVAFYTDRVDAIDLFQKNDE